MKSRIIWVFGSSAAGKETYIRALITDSTLPLRERLGRQGYVLHPIAASIDDIAQFSGDPTERKRNYIISELHECCKKDDCIYLIKGQDCDFDNGIFDTVLSDFSEYDISIIHLHAPLDILWERVQNKPRWTGKVTKEEFVDWLRYQIEELQKYTMPIVGIDSSTPDYKIVTFPPHI